jgi:hypothetical protein
VHESNTRLVALVFIAGALFVILGEFKACQAIF